MIVCGSPEYLSAEWHEWRRNHIGASDVPVLMGCNDFKTKLQLWQEKTGAAPADMTTSPQAEMGHILEPMVLRLCANQFDLISSQSGYVSSVTLVGATTQEAKLVASLDGLFKMTRQENEQERLMVAEAKTVNKAKFSRIQSQGTPLIEHWWQVQAQLLACPEAAGAVIGYLCRDNGAFKMFTVWRDTDAEAEITEACCAFWACVESRTQPDDAAAQEKEAGLMLEADPVLADTIQEFAKWKGIKTQADDIVESLRDELVEAMMVKRAKGFYTPNAVVTGSKTDGRKTVDWKAVASEAGVAQSIIDRNTAIGDPSWRITLKVPKP